MPKKRKRNKTEQENPGHILKNVPDHQVFNCQDGTKFKSLEELSIALKTMRTGIFLYHVHPGTNDFANWIYNVIGDIDLANNLRDMTDQKDFIKKIYSRISSIKSTQKEKE
jgi:hypothetical protein